MTANPQPLSSWQSPLETRAEAVVLFADLRGFTAMAEQLPPDVVVRLLNELFALLADAAVRHDGRIFHLAGDCRMVGFGVLEDSTSAASRAAQAARAMLDGFAPLATRWQRDHGIEAGLGIGIHQGEVVAGQVGAAIYHSYTLVGDTVNIASRLCARARAGEMLFSQRFKVSLDACGVQVETLALPALQLRGRRNPIDIFCVPLAERLQALPVV